jgi:hypothetical protein
MRIKAAILGILKAKDGSLGLRDAFFMAGSAYDLRQQVTKYRALFWAIYYTDGAPVLLAIGRR